MNRRTFCRRSCKGAMGMLLGMATWSRFEAGWISIDRRSVAIPNLPLPFEGKTIAVIADPHHGPFNSLSFIETIVRMVNALQPDLIAMVGDYVQGHQGQRYIDPAMAAFGRLWAPLGIYAVPGNHDHSEGIDAIRDGMTCQGMIDVTNSGRWLTLNGSRLRIAGVDDLWYGEQDLSSALGDATEDDAVLLLCHNPDYVETLRDRRVGLVLSGHMHGGQVVIPGLGYRRLPSRYGTRYLEGLIQGPFTQVFVSRGLGTVSLPIRFRCRPEINLLTLTRSHSSTGLVATGE